MYPQVPARNRAASCNRLRNAIVQLLRSTDRDQDLDVGPGSYGAHTIHYTMEMWAHGDFSTVYTCINSLPYEG